MRSLLITISAFVTLVIGQSPPYQHRSSQDAAILSDARYLSGDGTFGAAYTQEDGVEFKEESDANGDRVGSYSYVDPTGHRRTVSYTAGKNGFQATGDGIPKPRPLVAPQPEYEPLPQYNPPDYRPPQRVYRAQDEPQSNYAQESIYQPQQPQYYSGPQYPNSPLFEPHPQSVSRRNSPLSYGSQPEFEYQNQPQYQSKLSPRSQYPNKPPPRYQYQSKQPPRSQYPVKPPPRYQYQDHLAPRSQYQDQPPPRSPYNEITTPVPRRFYPPGKLDFNRTPDGFSYTFSKS